VLALHDSDTLCCGEAAPVPVKEAETGELEALLSNDTLAEAVPLACGLNRTLNETLWPGASVSGNDNPLRTNSELVEVAEVIVVLAPLTLRVALSVSLAPTTTLPKLKLVGDAAS
jgi:hypothetical protein